MCGCDSCLLSNAQTYTYMYEYYSISAYKGLKCNFLSGQLFDYLKKTKYNYCLENINKVPHGLQYQEKIKSFFLLQNLMLHYMYYIFVNIFTMYKTKSMWVLNLYISKRIIHLVASLICSTFKTEH